MKVVSIEMVDEILTDCVSMSNEDYSKAMRLIRGAVLEMDDKDVQEQIRASARREDDE